MIRSRTTTFLACALAAFAAPPAVAGDIDTSAWSLPPGTAATAANTGLAELSGTGLAFAVEPDGAAQRPYITSTPGTGLSFSPRSATLPAGDAVRSWFAFRARRTGTPANSASLRIHDAAGANLRTTLYTRLDDFASTPAGAYAKAHGLSLHAQSNYNGGQNAVLAFSEWNGGLPCISWDRWTSVEVEIVRSVSGRYVVSVNGTPVSGVVAQNTNPLTPAQLAAAARIALPALPGVCWEVGGPIGWSDQARTYDRAGTQYGGGRSVHRLMSVPPTLAAPWSPFTVSGQGATFSVNAYTAGGLTPDHYRVVMSGSTAAEGAIVSSPLGAVPQDSAWATLVLRTVLVTPGATATMILDQPGAPLGLEVSGGWLRCGGAPVLPWNHDRRYAVCLHMRTGSAAGERAISLFDLSVDTLADQLVYSAPLPPSGSPLTQLGAVELHGQFASPGSVELGGVALCRRLDLLAIDSYTSAFTNMPAPRLAILSRLGRDCFAGTDIDLVPGRPLPVAERDESPMLLFPVGRSGHRLSVFLSTSAQGAAWCRGSRWLLECGFVNDLSNQSWDPYWVTTPALAVQKADSVASAFSTFVAQTAAAGNEFIIGTTLPAPFYQTNTPKTIAFSEFNNRLRAIAAANASGGLVRLADADARFSPSQQAAFFGADGVHLNALGDIAYLGLLVDAAAAPPAATPTLDWVASGGSYASLSAGELTLDALAGQPEGAAESGAATEWGQLTLTGGFFADDSSGPCIRARAIGPSDALCPGESVELSAQVLGAAPVSYAWRKDGSPLAAGASPTLAIPLLSATMDGEYDCVVASACGSVTTPPVRLHVDPADVGVQGGLPGRDGAHDNNDVVVFVSRFFQADPAADLGLQGGLFGSDGLFNNNDFVVFIDLYFDPC